MISSINAVDLRVAAATLACGLAWPGGVAQTPVFRAEADLVTIDVQVTAKNGGAVPPLDGERFEVRIDGRKRTLQFATFVHEDDGAVVRGLTAPRLDPALGAPCIFRSLRTGNGTHAHYRLGIEPTDSDRRTIGKVRVRPTVKDLRIVRWTWRSPPKGRGPS